jgi:hypothetical protein
MPSSQPLGPFKLVTVNRHKNIAQDIMGRTILSLTEKFTIIHTANVDSKCFFTRAMSAASP